MEGKNHDTRRDAGDTTDAKNARSKPKLKIVKQVDIEEKDESSKLIRENLFLLSELDKLKHSNSSLSQRLYYLESIVRVPLKKC